MDKELLILLRMKMDNSRKKEIAAAADLILSNNTNNKYLGITSFLALKEPLSHLLYEIIIQAKKLAEENYAEIQYGLANSIHTTKLSNLELKQYIKINDFKIILYYKANPAFIEIKHIKLKLITENTKSRTFHTLFNKAVGREHNVDIMRHLKSFLLTNLNDAITTDLILYIKNIVKTGIYE